MDYFNYSSNEDDNVDDVSIVDDDIDYNDEYSEHIEVNDLCQSNAIIMSDLEFIAKNAIEESFTHYVSNIQSTLNAYAHNIDNDTNNNESSDSDSDKDGNVNDEGSDSSSCDSESLNNNRNKSNINTYKKNIFKIESFMTEEEEESSAIGPMKTKNEMEEEVEDVTIKKIDLHLIDKLVSIGHVLYRIDSECVVVIQAAYTNNPLSEGSMLCNKSGVVLGKIHEIFGPISTPFYTIRWKNISNNDISNNNDSKTNNNKESKNKKRKNHKNNSKYDIKESTSTSSYNNNDDNNNYNNSNNHNNDNNILTTTTLEALVAVEDTTNSTKDTDIDKLPSIETTNTILGDVHIIDNNNNNNNNIIEDNHNKLLHNDCNNNIDVIVVPKENIDLTKLNENNPTSSVTKLLDMSNIQLNFPIGADVYTISDQCTFVMPHQLRIMYGKGSDASNAYDEEPHEHELEYSDDEQELLAKQALNKSKKETKNLNSISTPIVQVQNQYSNNTNITKKRTSNHNNKTNNNNNNNNNHRYVSNIHKNHLQSHSNQVTYNNIPNPHQVYPYPNHVNAHTGYSANPLMNPNNIYYNPIVSSNVAPTPPYPINYTASYPIQYPPPTIQPTYYNQYPLNSNNNNINNNNINNNNINNNYNQHIHMNHHLQATIPLSQYQYQPILFNNSSINPNNNTTKK